MITRPEALVIGESLVDEVEYADGTTEATPGGSPANVAVGLGRLGRKPLLWTSYALDEAGRLIDGHLRASGVATLRDPPTTGRTSGARATIDSAGAARYSFDLEWSLGPRSAADVVAPMVHAGSLAVYREPGCATVIGELSRRRDTALVSVDPNVRPSLIGDEAAVRHRLDEALSLAHVIKASDEDVAWMHPGSDPIEVVDDWVARGAALACVTLGAEGAYLATARARVLVPQRAAAVVDTIGAGDTFAAALLDRLLAFGGRDRVLSGLMRDDLLAVGRYGNAAARLTVQRRGAALPSRAEVEAELR